jgi:hypothetical protein
MMLGEGIIEGGADRFRTGLCLVDRIHQILQPLGVFRDWISGCQRVEVDVSAEGAGACPQWLAWGEPCALVEGLQLLCCAALLKSPDRTISKLRSSCCGRISLILIFKL